MYLLALGRRIRHFFLELRYRLQQPLSFLDFFKNAWMAFVESVQTVFYLPTILVRLGLQWFTDSHHKTRYFLHAFIVAFTFLISIGGILPKGELGHIAVSASTRYVTGFGSQVESSKYAAILDNGYLAKSNIATTDVRSRRTEGIEDYVIQPGDTASTIAYRFGLSTKALQWANQLQDINRLRPGQTLTILPTSGVIHKVEEGESVASLSQKYEVPEARLREANQLIAAVQLVNEQEIVVPLPDSRIPDMPKPEPPPPSPAVASRPAASTASPGGLSVSSANVGATVGSGAFAWPTSGRITRNFYQHARGDGAIDIANRSRPPVYASDGGVVVVAGWDRTGYGNRVDINHGNGFITRYAHLDGIYVSTGQQVSRGQVIGQMGCTGRCSGPHVHFMIILNGVPVNPESYL